jgi:two-component system cell cycle sensor histidine kinase/response regulator CckA
LRAHPKDRIYMTEEPTYKKLQQRIQELEEESARGRYAEEALRISEQRMRLALEGTDQGLWEFDLLTQEVIYSHNWQKILGYGPDESRFDYHWWISQIHPDSLSVFDKALTDYMLGNTKYLDWEYQIKNKEGEWQWVHANGIFTDKDSSGVPIKMIGTHRNISHRKRIEKAFREGEERFRMLAENARDSIWTMDMELRYTYMSPYVKHMLDYTPEECVAIPLSKIMTPDSLERCMQVMYEELENEKRTDRNPLRSRIVEVEYIHKNGGRVPAEVKMTFLRNADGRAVGILGYTRDITESKRTAEALKESEEKYRLIAENMADVISILDMNLRFTYTSPSIMRLRGLTVEEALQQTLDQVLTPESMKTALAAFEEEMKLEADGTAVPNRIRTMEMEEYRKDGSVIWVEVSMSYLRDKDLKPVGMLAVTRDLSERKQAEEERRKLEDRLRHTDKMEAIGTLAGGIAHDFNNLLMGMQGYASLMLLEVDSSHPFYERLRLIEDQIRSGAELTGQLLGFARGGRYEVKSADINEIVEKSASLFGRTKKEISIHRRYGTNLWSVELDRGQMEQVFMNLFVNAWQAMPGGGEIFLETENLLLDDVRALSYSVSPGKYVKISVTDTGTGMDEKTRERIFDPFFTTKGMGRGTGLGLATVYGIVKGHKGAINVYSEPGHGTTFNIYLPASGKAVIEDKKATETLAMGTETILLVDDEKMVLDVSRKMLEILGYKVYAVGSGQEAVAVYMEKKQEIDLVLLDMIMPGISGGQTFDRIREINPEIKVLLSSGYSINGEAKGIMDRGCEGFIQKPFQLEKLSRKIREVLR